MHNFFLHKTSFVTPCGAHPSDALVVYVLIPPGVFAASAMGVCPEVMVCTRLAVNSIHAARVGAELGAVPAINVWTPRKIVN